MISPRLTSVYGRMCLETGPEGEKASLSTSRWSPMSSVSSMDPVGITKACTRFVATLGSHSPPDSTLHSRNFLASPLIPNTPTADYFRVDKQTWHRPSFFVGCQSSFFVVRQLRS